MPSYSFEVLDRGSEPDGGGRRRELVTADLPDREAARDYAIGLAECLLREAEGLPRAKDGIDGRPSSLITIRNQAGDMLDVVRSVSF